MKKLSRQRCWQLKMQAAGRCPLCGARKAEGVATIACPTCSAKRRRANRARCGCKPWRKGSRGRPPLSASGNRP